MPESVLLMPQFDIIVLQFAQFHAILIILVIANQNILLKFKFLIEIIIYMCYY